MLPGLDIPSDPGKTESSAKIHVVGRGAVLSEDGLYRYRLWRTLKLTSEPKRCTFVMLNPSTADANKDDATIKKILRFASKWGMDHLDVVNLFAFRATQPKDCMAAQDPVGPENDRHIIEAVTGANVVVLAWGTQGTARGRNQTVLNMLKAHGASPQALWFTDAGHPQHPLYLPLSSELKPFPFPLRRAPESARKGYLVRRAFDS